MPPHFVMEEDAMQKIGIGYENYKDFIDEKLYYVDKTLLIRDQKYEEGILADGYAGVQSYGICFCRKDCIVGKYPGYGGTN